MMPLPIRSATPPEQKQEPEGFHPSHYCCVCDGYIYTDEWRASLEANNGPCHAGCTPIREERVR